MRKAYIGALGITVAIIVLLLTGCKGTEDTGGEAQFSTVHLNPGQKLVSCGWQSYNFWYLTRPMGADEKATEYEYWRGDQKLMIKIKEEARRDMSGSSHMRAREAMMRSFHED